MITLFKKITVSFVASKVGWENCAGSATAEVIG